MQDSPACVAGLEMAMLLACILLLLLLLLAVCCLWSIWVC